MHTRGTQAICVIAGDKIPLSVIQFYRVALAFADIACPAFKTIITAGANFMFMPGHGERCKVEKVKGVRQMP